MKRPWSIAFSLALWLSIGTGCFWLGAAAISTIVLQRELKEAFDETLSQSAYRLLPLALHDLREPGERHSPVEGLSEFNDAAFTYFIHDGTGNVIIRANDAPESITTVPVTDGYLDLDGRRGYAVTDRRTGLGIVVLEMSNHRGEALGDAAATLFWPLAGLLPLIAIGIWLAVRLAMRPLKRLSHDIALRDSANLDPLAHADQPAELAPIAQEVEALLVRLKSAMEAERTFAANSAHELRTPIAGALAQTQRLALELGEHPARGRVADVEHALRHLSQLSEKLLQLARLEAGFARADAPVDLKPVIDLVVRDFNDAQATAGRVHLSVAPDAGLCVPINPDAFAIALRNLVQNAFIHGADYGDITVRAGPGPVVSVTNSGPVVAPEILAQLGQRFARGDTSASGSGLGLAIVAAIMQQSGGRLVLLSPAPNQTDGFSGELILE